MLTYACFFIFKPLELKNHQYHQRHRITGKLWHGLHRLNTVTHMHWKNNNKTNKKYQGLVFIFNFQFSFTDGLIANILLGIKSLKSVEFNAHEI